MRIASSLGLLIQPARPKAVPDSEAIVRLLFDGMLA
jgi:hypothetical protein